MYTGLPVWAADLLRNPHTQYGVVKAQYQGSWLQLEDDGGLAVIDRTVLPLVDGTVQVDGSTPGARRTLTVTLAPTPGLFDLLAPPGVELCAYSVLRAPNGDTVTIPQGVFPIDTLQRTSYLANGDIGITNVPDRWSKIRNARFLAPRQFGGGTVQQQITNLLLEALPAGASVTDLSTQTAPMPVQTEDRNRDALITAAAAAASLDVFFDRSGNPVIRNVPVLGVQPVWLVDASATGVLVDADRQRSLQKTYNVVVVNSQTTGGSPLFDPVIAWDNNPASPTYAGPGAGVGAITDLPPSSSAGPFGQRPIFYSSPLVTSAAQAQQVASTRLALVTGLAKQLTLTAVPHPGLDDGDTLMVQLPQERYDLGRPVEMHLVDSFTIPLRPGKGAPQTIATRSNRPDTASDS